MPTITNVTLSLVKDVANMDITLNYDIEWTAFEQATDLEFDEAWKLIGDDTNQDGDNLPVGDDPISLGLLMPLIRVSSNGNAVTHRTKTKTIAFSNLDEDVGVNEDDEIRAVVTLTPLLPVATSRESDMVPVNA
jgi:hypothetical protein